MEWDVQETHAHGDANTDLLSGAHLQTPDQGPRQQRQIEVGDCAPGSIEDAIVNSIHGVPAVSFKRWVPSFCCGRALDPGDEGRWQHEDEERDDAEPDAPSDLPSSES
jgi:hypothetical protein